MKLLDIIKKIVHKVLYTYIDWERTNYKLKKIEVGSYVVSNWKAKVFFKDTEVKLLTKPEKVVENGQADNNFVVETENDHFSSYWLKVVKK